MGLQVRLRHALGERLLDLSDRTVENPLIVGRAREADLKIPSVTVANQHCALFLHENQWVLQDTSGGATWINGNALEGPTPLCIGDVIVLGSDGSPATIEVSPAGAAEGRTGYPAEGHAPPAGSAPSRSMQPSGGSYGSAAARHAPAPPPVASDDAWGAPATEDDGFAAWQAPAAESAQASAGVSAARRKRPPKQMSQGALVGGIAVCVVIVGVTIWAVYKEMHPEAPPPPPPAAPVDNTRHQNSIFDTGINTPQSPVKPNPAAVTLASARPPARAPGRALPPRSPAPAPGNDSADAAPSSAGSPEAAPAPDAPDAAPAKNDKAWEEVEAANFSPEIGQAILKFDDYRRQHAGVKTKELDGYIDDAMDRLWWKRITLLCTKRSEINKSIQGKDKDLREETNAKFKQTLAGEKKELQDQLARVQEHLVTDMGYTAEDAPNLDDQDAMSKATAARDASKFGAWKVRTLKFIRNNHGATPWDGE